MKINPSYYAIIPANVRYSDVPANAKLLYGEITALCSKEGYCWATNTYFAKLYKVSRQSVSSWVGELKKKGFIDFKVEDKYRRKIFLIPLERKLCTPLERKPDNSITSISIKTNIPAKPVQFSLKEEIKKLKDSPQRHVMLIGEYLEEKNVRLDTKEQFKHAIQRHLQAARKLSDFSDEQIAKASKKAAEWPAWTMESVLKILVR